jgi:hypothetical protein
LFLWNVVIHENHSEAKGLNIYHERNRINLRTRCTENLAISFHRTSLYLLRVNYLWIHNLQRHGALQNGIVQWPSTVGPRQEAAKKTIVFKLCLFTICQDLYLTSVRRKINRLLNEQVISRLWCLALIPHWSSRCNRSVWFATKPKFKSRYIY